MFAPNAAPNKPFGLPISVFCNLGHFRKESWGHFASTLGRPFPGGGYPARLMNAWRMAAPWREVIPPLPILKYAFCGFAQMTASNVIIFVKIRSAQIPMCKNSLPSGSFGNRTIDPQKTALEPILFYALRVFFLCKNDGFKYRQFLWKSPPREIRWEKQFSIWVISGIAQSVPENMAFRHMIYSHSKKSRRVCITE